MNISQKNTILPILDKVVLFALIGDMIFLPASNAALSIFSGLIMLALIIRLSVLGFNKVSLKSFFSDRLIVAVWVYWIACCVSLFAGGSYSAHTFRSIFTKAGEGVMLFTALQIFLKPKDVVLLLKVFLVVGVIVLADAFFQIKTGHDFIRGYELLSTELGGFASPNATFNHYNDFATYLIVLFYFGLGMWMAARKFTLRVVFGLLMGTTLVCLLLTHSRGAWVGAGVAGVCVLIFGNRDARLVMVGMAAILGLVFLMVPSVGERFLLSFQKGGDVGRIEIWEATIHMIKDSPIVGHGLGNFYSVFPEYSANKAGFYAHNCFLQIFAETGILGLVSFMWILFEVFLKALKYIAKDKNGLVIGLTAALVAYLGHCLFDTPFYSVKLSLLFWMILAFLNIQLVKNSLEKT